MCIRDRLGGIFAFFDTSGMHYGYLPLTIHSYAWHILLITLGFIRDVYKRQSHSTVRTVRYTALSIVDVHRLIGLSLIHI